jgi:hypothetical protein
MKPYNNITKCHQEECIIFFSWKPKFFSSLHLLNSCVIALTNLLCGTELQTKRVTIKNRDNSLQHLGCTLAVLPGKVSITQDLFPSTKQSWPINT